MEKEELKSAVEKAEKLAWDYEQKFGGCAQVVLAAVKETVGRIGDDVFLAATGLAGGVARTGNACGALTGGVMALSCFLGRPYDDFADAGNRRARTISMCKALANKFQESYSSHNCNMIQKHLMGRSYDMNDQQDFQRFVSNGGHKDKCPSICANSARWVLEILNDEGLI